MISAMKAGTKITQALLVRVQKIGNSSNGGVFARGSLEDNSGKINFICFEAALVDKLREIDAPTPFMVHGSVDISKYSTEMTLQVIIQKLTDLLPEDDISSLLPHGNFSVEEYKTKLNNYIKAVRSPILRTLLESVFSGPVYEKFIQNPAGMKMHHAYIGGLLKHTVDVTNLAVAMAGQVENVDKDVVIAGALLHDVGKIREISSQIGFPYTNEGRLLGHISMSVLIVQEAATKLKIPAARLEHLYHVLLSHHGENEKGSPIACATKEAFIVHYADEFNAVMEQFDPKEGVTGPWEFNKMLQRNIMVGKL